VGGNGEPTRSNRHTVRNGDTRFRNAGRLHGRTGEGPLDASHADDRGGQDRGQRHPSSPRLIEHVVSVPPTCPNIGHKWSFTVAIHAQTMLKSTGGAISQAENGSIVRCVPRRSDTDPESPS